MVRKGLKNAGLNPYDFYGYERKALRNYLNGEATEEDLQIINDNENLRKFNKYKVGGNLPSLDPIERFKLERRTYYR